jgi:hypothetical protein
VSWKYLLKGEKGYSDWFPVKMKIKKENGRGRNFPFFTIEIWMKRIITF